MWRAVLPGRADRQEGRNRLAGRDVSACGDGRNRCRYRFGTGRRGGQHGRIVTGGRYLRRQHDHHYFTGDAGCYRIGLGAVPRLPGDYPDPDRGVGRLCAVVLYGRGGSDANP
ncbi:hypothetical protein D3C76_1265870 [compost metagenome]